MTLLLAASRRLQLSNIMLGGAGIVGMYGKAVPKGQAIEALQYAVERGVSSYDTAPFYGCGVSEAYFGEVLPASCHISTKVGKVLRPIEQCRPGDPHVAWDALDFFCVEDRHQHVLVPVHDYSGSAALESYQSSRARLGKDSIACLRVHDCETEEYFDDTVAENGAIEALLELKRKGKIQQVSLGLNDAAFMLRLVQHFPVGTFDNVLIAGSWNLVDHSAIHLLQECSQRDIKVINAGVFGGGLLWGIPKVRYNKASKEVLKTVQQWTLLANEFHVPLGAIAMHFAFLPDIVSHVCLGFNSKEQVKANLDLLKHEIPINLWISAQQQQLLPESIQFIQ